MSTKHEMGEGVVVQGCKDAKNCYSLEYLFWRIIIHINPETL